MSAPGIAYRANPRRRATAFLLTVAVHVLAVILVLLQPTMSPVLRNVRETLTIFELQPEPEPEPVPVPALEKPTRLEPPPAPIEAEKPIPPSVVQPIIVPPLPSIQTPLPPAAEPVMESAPAIAPDPPPNRGQFQAGDWQENITTAQLAPYLPRRGGMPGEGAVYCQTVANYRVRNCRILDEKPAGSGFARAIQRASGLFRIKPPMIDGRPNIGAWVTIRIRITPPVPAP